MSQIATTKAASIILAAGKGSRMTGYSGNKTLLPLIAGENLYVGEKPLLFEVLENLPPGPKGIVVHHRWDDVRRATQDMELTYIFQPELNGTGGALLASSEFIERVSNDHVLITMGDVPLIRSSTYLEMIAQLQYHSLVVLAFEPEEKSQYGLIETENGKVTRVIEWKYWRSFRREHRARLRFSNAGVYAVWRTLLLSYRQPLTDRPHFVQKKWGEQQVTIKEYFLTDLVQLMSEHGHSIGMVVVDETEVMGVDTPEALQAVQKHYAERGCR